MGRFCNAKWGFFGSACVRACVCFKDFFVCACVTLALTAIVQPGADFSPIANALEVLIHFDMLIRGHYARNKIKWQQEAISLSVN